MIRPIRNPIRLCRYLVPLLVVMLLPATALAGQSPVASFSFTPQNPRVGDQMVFESSSCDPEGSLVREAWDFDGDGEFDDDEGPATRRTFLDSGPHTVGLQVTDSSGASDVAHRTVIVDSAFALPRPDVPPVMTPFPIVTMAGRLDGAGARIKLLSVRAPVCALVDVSCHGRGCPAERVLAIVGQKPLRLHRLERRLAGGSVLTVRVSKGPLIGKFTEFRIRSGAEPKRRDMCLKPGSRAGSRCPRG